MTPTRPRLAGSPFFAIARMIEQCGGVEQVAAFVNRSQSTVYKWTDPEQSDGPPFSVIAQMAAQFRATAAAEHLAVRSGGFFLPLPDPESGDRRWGDLSAAAAVESGEVMAQIVRSLSPDSDGKSTVTPAEAAKLQAEIDDLMGVLARLRAEAQNVVDGGEGR